MTTNTKDRLEQPIPQEERTEPVLRLMKIITDYYSKNRSVGQSRIQIEGLDRVRDKPNLPIILVRNPTTCDLAQYGYIRHMEDVMTGFYILPEGTTQPLVIEQTCLEIILNEAVTAIERFQRQTSGRLQQQVRDHQEKILALQRENHDLQCRLAKFDELGRLHRKTEILIDELWPEEEGETK